MKTVTLMIVYIKNDEQEIDIFGETLVITEIGNLAPSNSDIYTVVSGLVYDGTDYRAIIDIDDTQEITAFEHILKIFSHLGLDS